MTSNARDHATTGDDALHAEAASWFVRIHAGEPGTEEVADWQRWLMADEAHRHAFSRFEDLWQTIGQTEPHLRTQSRSEVDAPARSRTIQRRWPLAIAATALVATVGAGFLLSRSIRSHQLPGSAVVETRTAEDRRYVLTDGSRIDVGARTRVVVDFSGPTRSVIIDDGEAYFEVAHEARPFVVRAGSGTITAVGTAFNVHHVQGRVAVAVVEGAVNVREFVDDDGASVAPVISGTSAPAAPRPPAVIVRAGEGVIYGRAAKAVEAVDPNVATAWRDGHLKFIREPLGYVVADVERYTNTQISIADPAVAELLYTGTVIPDEIDDWLALLAHAFPIEAQRIEGRMVLLKLRTDASDLSATVER